MNDRYAPRTKLSWFIHLPMDVTLATTPHTYKFARADVIHPTYNPPLPRPRRTMHA